jgi:hypothetical protein
MFADKPSSVNAGDYRRLHLAYTAPPCPSSPVYLSAKPLVRHSLFPPFFTQHNTQSITHLQPKPYSSVRNPTTSSTCIVSLKNLVKQPPTTPTKQHRTKRSRHLLSITPSSRRFPTSLTREFTRRCHEMTRGKTADSVVVSITRSQEPVALPLPEEHRTLSILNKGRPSITNRSSLSNRFFALQSQ